MSKIPFKRIVIYRFVKRYLLSVLGSWWD